METLPLIDSGAGGQKVDFDVYPYDAGSTVLMPQRLRQDVPVQITWSVPHPELAGRMLDDIARGMGHRSDARPPNGCCPPARSSSRWTSPTCSGSWRIAWR